MRTMKAVAKIGVIRFRIGTEAITGDDQPAQQHRDADSPCATASPPRPGDGAWRRARNIHARADIRCRDRRRSGSRPGSATGTARGCSPRARRRRTSAQARWPAAWRARCPEDRRDNSCARLARRCRRDRGSAISEVTGGIRKIDPTTSASPPSHSMVFSIQPGHCTKWLNVHSMPMMRRTRRPMVKPTHFQSTARNGGVNSSWKA